MLKKIIFILLLAVSMFTITACGKKEVKKEEKKEISTSEKFKNSYESLNGKENSALEIHRTVSIPKDNPFEEISAKDLLTKIENKETFYVYFGDKLCPWCRSVIETAIKVAKENNIEKIYYISIWDDEGNEILRDKYEMQDNKVIKVLDGTEEYNKLLEIFDDVLANYTLTNSKEKEVKVGEKRIYAPNFIYIKDGKAIKLTDGISDKQKEPREELTEDILKDEEILFNKFFKN